MYKKLHKDGYVISSERINAEELKSLEAFYYQHAREHNGFHTTFDLQSAEAKRLINRRLIKAIDPHVKTLFPDYRLVVANFVVKEPSKDSFLPFHRDWSVVDELRFSGYSIWFPLIDLNQENGAIGFCKGTHKNAPRYRSPSNPAGLIETSVELEKNVEFPRIEAGQLAVFNHATVHCSKANNSSRPRIAVTAVIVPKEAKGLHYFFEENGSKMLTYEVDEEFYFQYEIGAQMPKGVKKYEPNQKFSFRKILSRFKL